ncbi:hypothetical protein ACWD6R_39830 [Streptomyces sp. NPDC005151]
MFHELVNSLGSNPASGNGRVSARPVFVHVQGLLEQRPDVSVAAVARCAGVAASTVKSLLHDAARGGGEGRAVSRVLADRLLAVGVADLPQPGCGYGGRSTDAAPAMRHIRHLIGSHPGLSMSVLARAAGMTPSTLAAALKDVEAGRPRRIQASAAERPSPSAAALLSPKDKRGAVTLSMPHPSPPMYAISHPPSGEASVAALGGRLPPSRARWMRVRTIRVRDLFG